MPLILFNGSHALGALNVSPPPVDVTCVIKHNLHWLYSLPSLLVIFYVTYLLLDFRKLAMKKEFKTIFFNFLLHDFLLVTIVFFVDVLVDRLPQTGLYFHFLLDHDPDIVFRILYTSLNAGFTTTYASSFSLSLIRMLTLIFPTTVQNQINRLRFLILIFIYLVGFGTQFFRFFEHPNFYYHAFEPCPVMYFQAEPAFPTKLTSTLVLCVYASLLLATATVIIITLIYIKKNTMVYVSSRARKAERTLTIIGAMAFFTLAQNIIFQAHMIFIGTSTTLFSLNKIFWDIFSFSNAWILFITHPEIRRHTPLKFLDSKRSTILVVKSS